jgi:CRP-like cAMP-binding protein
MPVISTAHNLPSGIAELLSESLLCGAAKMLDLSARTILFRQDEPPCGFYLLREGELSRFHLSPQGSTELPNANPGSVLGLVASTQSALHAYTASAHSNCWLEFVPRDVWLELIQARPLLRLRALRLMAGELSQAYQDRASTAALTR